MRRDNGPYPSPTVHDPPSTVYRLQSTICHTTLHPSPTTHPPRFMLQRPTASPDFGIVPSGILAIFVLQYFSTYKVLLLGQFVIAGTAFIAICLPSAASLISARALAGLFWGMAAVHYPTWINRYGGEQRTMWLAIYNVFLLVGILLGYAIGAVASR